MPTERPRTERARTERSRSFELFGGPVVVGLALMLIVGVIAVAGFKIRQSNQIADNVAVTDALVEANVRVLGQTQVELLRLLEVVDDPKTDAQTLALHRGFVNQRLTEARRTEQVGDPAGSDRYRTAIEEVNARWEVEVAEPLGRLIAGTGTDADRADAVESIRSLERSVNEITSWSEIERRRLARLANDQIEAIISTNRILVVVQGAFLVVLALIVMLTARHIAGIDRQRSAVARRTSELNLQLQTLSGVAERSASGVAICSPDGRTQWTNDAFGRITGHQPFSPDRPHWEGLLDTDDEARLGAAVAAGLATSWECAVATADGRRLWVEVEVQPVRGGDAELLNVIVIYNDVTTRRDLEENLRASARDAQDAADAKARFLATMSHEIRTPLSAVLAMNELLLDSGLDEEQLEYARSAHTGGRLLLDLVNDILTFSRVEADQIQLELRRIDIGAMFAEVAELLGPQARDRGVDIEWSVADTVPPTVVTDPGKLRQILINLVGNGIKFTPGGRVTMRAETAPVGGELLLSVADDGIGIPAHRLDAVLAPFTQVDGSVSRVYGGSGLGLAICKGLVDAMSGELELDSIEGIGTTVTVRLPLRISDGPVIETPEPSEHHDAERAEASPLSVLVAEDNAMNQRVISLFLERLGVQPHIVDDGRAAIEALQSRPFDVVLMDLHMPVCDGETATREIRATLPADRQPYVVALTADVAAADREWLFDAGMDAHLTKPYTMAALSEVLAGAERARRKPAAEATR